MKRTINKIESGEDHSVIGGVLFSKNITKSNFDIFFRRSTNAPYAFVVIGLSGKREIFFGQCDRHSTLESMLLSNGKLPRVVLRGQVWKRGEKVDLIQIYDDRVFNYFEEFKTKKMVRGLVREILDTIDPSLLAERVSISLGGPRLSYLYFKDVQKLSPVSGGKIGKYKKEA